LLLYQNKRMKIIKKNKKIYLLLLFLKNIKIHFKTVLKINLL